MLTILSDTTLKAMDSLTKEMSRVRNLITLFEDRGWYNSAHVARYTLERADIALADADVESIAAAHKDLKEICL
jgi:hypothetical protein